MRTNYVKKARKAQGTCGGCGKEIAVGDAYKWIKGFRSSRKVRCDECNFRPSDKTSSKMGAVYDVQEDVSSQVDGWAGELTAPLSESLDRLIEVVREVGEEYQESADNIRENFSESPTADECEEKAGDLDAWADDLEMARDELEEFFDFDEDAAEIDEGSIDEWTTREDLIEEAKDEAFDAWQEEQREKVQDVVDDCPV